MIKIMPGGGNGQAASSPLYDWYILTLVFLGSSCCGIAEMNN